MTDLRCSNCGAEIVERALYCPTCGTPTSAAVPAPTPPPPEQAPSDGPPPEPSTAGSAEEVAYARSEEGPGAVPTPSSDDPTLTEPVPDDSRATDDVDRPSTGSTPPAAEPPRPAPPIAPPGWPVAGSAGPSTGAGPASAPSGPAPTGPGSSASSSPGPTSPPSAYGSPYAPPAPAGRPGPLAGPPAGPGTAPPVAGAGSADWSTPPSSPPMAPGAGRPGAGPPVAAPTAPVAVVPGRSRRAGGGDGRPVVGVLAILGGAAAVVSVWLTWISIDLPGFGRSSASGWHSTQDAKVALALGVASVLLGAVLFARRAAVVSALIAVAGLGAVAVGIRDLLDVGPVADDIASSGLRVSGHQAGVGLYVLLAAGAVLVATGVVALASSRRGEVRIGE